MRFPCLFPRPSKADIWIPANAHPGTLTARQRERLWRRALLIRIATPITLMHRKRPILSGFIVSARRRRLQ
jgi:hypothetical protein